MTTYDCPARRLSLRCLCKSALLLAALLWAAGAGAAEPADVLKTAVEKLARGSNYTWTTTFTFPDAPIHPGPLNGQIDATGYVLLSQNVGRGDFVAVVKNGLGVLKLPVGWLGAKEIIEGNPQGAIGPAMLMSRVLFNVRKPDVEVAELLKVGAAFTQDDKGVITEQLDESAAATLIRNGVTGRPNPQAPPLKQARGNVKYWVNDGLIEKYEINLQGQLLPSAHQNAVDFKPTTTVEITNVGTTKVQVPDAAREKLAALMAPPAPAAK
jgi:hypothetical protein